MSCSSRASRCGRLPPADAGVVDRPVSFRLCCLPLCQGCAHDVIHIIDDHLWLEGHGCIPDAPPVSVDEVEEKQRREAAQAAAEARARAAQEAVRRDVVCVCVCVCVCVRVCVCVCVCVCV